MNAVQCGGRCEGEGEEVRRWREMTRADCAPEWGGTHEADRCTLDTSSPTPLLALSSPPLLPPALRISHSSPSSLIPLSPFSPTDVLRSISRWRWRWGWGWGWEQSGARPCGVEERAPEDSADPGILSQSLCPASPPLSTLSLVPPSSPHLLLHAETPLLTLSVSLSATWLFPPCCVLPHSA